MSSVNCEQAQKSKKKASNIYAYTYICSQVPGTKGTYEYALILSDLVPGAAIYQLWGGVSYK